MRVILSLSFFAEGERYAADVALVQQITRNMAVTPVPTAPCAVVGIANLKGKAITLLSAAALMRPAGAAARAPKKASAVVFKPFAGDNDQMGLIIDRPGDLIEIEEEKITPPPLPDNIETAFCVSGIAEVNGALYRILNVKSVIDSFRNGGEPQGGISYEKPL